MDLTKRLIALLLVLPLLAACPTLPRPFMHDEAGDNPLLQPLGLRGIHVLPVSESETANALAQALVKAFEQAEIPASMRPAGPGSLVLKADSVEDRGTDILVQWNVREQREAGEARPAPVLASFTQNVQAGLWRNVTGQGLNRIAREAVQGLSRQLRDEVVQEDPKAMPSVSLLVEKVPGDGPRSLRRAMITALRREGIAVVENGLAVVEGVVTLGAVDEPDLEEVKIAWTVRTPAGAELGVIEQQNTIPKGKLSGPWGPEAYYIAEGGAAGVADLLTRVKSKLKPAGS